LEDETKLIQEQLKMDDVQAEIKGGLDEVKQVQKQAKADLTAWTTSPSIDPRKPQTGSLKVEDQAIVDETSAPATESALPGAPAPSESDAGSYPHEGDSSAKPEGA
jgi:hypothetical protein